MGLTAVLCLWFYPCFVLWLNLWLWWRHFRYSNHSPFPPKVLSVCTAGQSLRRNNELFPPPPSHPLNSHQCNEHWTLVCMHSVGHKCNDHTAHYSTHVLDHSHTIAMDQTKGWHLELVQRWNSLKQQDRIFVKICYTRIWSKKVNNLPPENITCNMCNPCIQFSCCTILSLTHMRKPSKNSNHIPNKLY